MTAERLLTLACKNIEETYLAIGSGAPGAEVRRLRGASLCLCQIDHPVGNFAVVRGPVGSDLDLVSAAAKSRRNFNIYVLPDGPCEQVCDDFEHRGFHRSYAQTALASRQRGGCSDLRFSELDSPADREKIAQFMASQFFFRLRTTVRTDIARATANSGLTLYAIQAGGVRVGAAMVSRTPGILGAYNLCVDGRHRRKGYGSAAVRHLQRLATRLGLAASLQCDEGLVPWYTRLGFETLGEVTVLSRRPS
jgi:ribosomal protein S18 acetylase RimI-like enzyme